ncbi:MAG: glycoside hydrolase family 28 protein, partial [Bacteroidaceae bacterium]|nr:glycoside hydrolase family 28 protein [Bacteroidaceae bacterium]
MKKILIIPAMLLAATSMFAQKLTMDEAFKQADKIVSDIRKTSFPYRKFNFCYFGAKCGDSTVLNHVAINNAIIACTTAGGGMVVVPKGTFYTGPITLKSNVNLHFEDGAVLKFTTDPTYYF